MQLIKVPAVFLVCLVFVTHINLSYGDNSWESNEEAPEEYTDLNKNGYYTKSNTFNEIETSTRMDQLTLQIQQMMLNIQDHIRRNRDVFTNIYEGLGQNKLQLNATSNRFTSEVTEVEKNITSSNTQLEKTRAEATEQLSELEEKYNNLSRKHNEIFNLMEENKKQVEHWNRRQKNYIHRVQADLNSLMNKLVSGITDPSRANRRL